MTGACDADFCTPTYTNDLCADAIQVDNIWCTTDGDCPTSVTCIHPDCDEDADCAVVGGTCDVGGTDTCVEGFCQSIVVAFDNRCATTDGPPTECEGASGSDMWYDVWYKYTAPSCGDLTVSTCEGVSWDGFIAGYSGNTDACAGDLQDDELACNDDGCGGAGPSIFTIDMSQEGEYLFRMGGWDNDGNIGDGQGEGEFTVHLEWEPCADFGPALVYGDDFPAAGGPAAKSCTGHADCNTGPCPDCPGATPWANPDGIAKCVANPDGSGSFCQVPKNRYLIFDPNKAFNDTQLVKFRVDLVSSDTATGGVGTTVGWVGEPVGSDGTSGTMCTSGTHRQAPVVGVAQAYASADWASPVVVADCEVLPTSLYRIVAVNASDTEALPLDVYTSDTPNLGRLWGDGVGPASPGVGWTPPDGYANNDDISACLKQFQGLAPTPNAKWVDLADEVPNGCVDPLQANFGDVSMFEKAFQGLPYGNSNWEFDPTACP